MSRFLLLKSELRNASMPISNFFDAEIRDKIKKLFNSYILFFFINCSWLIEWPITWTFFDLNGNEVGDAVTILSESLKALYKISFLSPNFGPGCVNHNVVLKLFFLIKNPIIKNYLGKMFCCVATSDTFDHCAVYIINWTDI